MIIDKKTFFLKSLYILFCFVFFIFFTNDILIAIEVCLSLYFFIDLAVEYKKNILLLCFLICFFVFLIAGPVAQDFFDAVEKRTYTDEAIIHSHICIIVSLITLIISNKLVRYKNDNISSIEKQHNEAIDLISLKIASKNFYWISYIFMFAYTLHIALFVLANGYLAYYTDYDAGVFVIIEKIGDMAPLAICMFFASYPTRAESKPLLFSYVIYGLFCLLTGKRFETVFVLLFVLIIYCYRGWLQKKHIIAIITLIPIALIGLQMVDLIRHGIDKAQTMSTTGNLIVDFMNYVGNSNKVIRLQYMYKDNIPPFRFYSFGSILDYFKYNPISKFIFGFSSDRYSRIYEGHSLSTIVSYFYSEKFFSSGQGMGSCYIAELYNDFGFIGIILGNFFIVYLIKNVLSLNDKSYIRRVICLMIIGPVLLMPRGNFDEMLLYIINFKYIIYFLAIYYIAKNFVRKKTVR